MLFSSSPRLLPLLPLLSCILSQAVAAELPQADLAPASAVVNIHAEQRLHTFDPRRLGGTNVALWNDKLHFDSPEIHQWIADLRPGLIRVPGGSWANCVYWNGNGVRNEQGKLDPTRLGPDGYPAVDYSGYAPGFNVNTDTLAPNTGFHGNVDVKRLFDWGKSIPGAELLPCPNAGSGRPIDAAEWVKWSNKNGYPAGIWEIGNELEGSWEPGYKLPHGKGTMTGKIFMERYNAIAAAMRAVDPTLKIGACSFHADLLREGGDLVDFVAIHNYWGSKTLSPKENLIQAPKMIAKQTAQVRELIQKYQPNRADQIEVSYTEWNLADGMNASDLFSGLWMSSILAAFVENRVDFATQWDVFTHSKGMDAGHGLIFTDGKKFTRKAGYYALWLWNNFTGNRLIHSSVDGPVQVLATKDEKTLYVMLLNPDEDQQAEVEVNLTGFPAAEIGESISLTHREYHWDLQNQCPAWSQPPRAHPIKVGACFAVRLPAFSVTYLKIPATGANRPLPLPPATPEIATPKPELRFLLPEELYAGDKGIGYLYAMQGDLPYPAPLPAASLSFEGAVVADRKQVSLSEALGRFEFVVRQEGPVSFKAEVGGARVSTQLLAKSSVPRPLLLWDFIKVPPTDSQHFGSKYELVSDLSQKANREVVRINLPPEGITPPTKSGEHRMAFQIKKLPGKEELNKANIRGIFFDMKCSEVVTEDTNASIAVVMQSPVNFWMMLGSVPLQGSEEWQRHELALNEKHYEAIATVHNIWFVINSKKPMKGSLFLDKIGLMVR